MAYNISNWETKRLGDFRIPIYMLGQGHRYGNLRIEVLGMVGEAVNLKLDGLVEGFQILGSMVGDEDDVHVNSIRLYGQSSGNFYHDAMEPALKQSKGYMEAILTWEGGEVIQHLIVKDGVISYGEQVHSQRMERLFELLPSVEHCIEMAEGDTDYYSEWLRKHPSHDSPDEQESLGNKQEALVMAQEFVRLFNELREG